MHMIVSSSEYGRLTGQAPIVSRGKRLRVAPRLARGL